ncbi:hypothetical protein EDD85DRAFT_969778 [Armillaria nabsnona]|nr:hypothetical protein EDD85DRAFT_969778 [Armillaria nabsnona]
MRNWLEIAVGIPTNTSLRRTQGHNSNVSLTRAYPKINVKFGRLRGDEWGAAMDTNIFWTRQELDSHETLRCWLLVVTTRLIVDLVGARWIWSHDRNHQIRTGVFLVSPTTTMTPINEGRGGLGLQRSILMARASLCWVKGHVNSSRSEAPIVLKTRMSNQPVVALDDETSRAVPTLATAVDRFVWGNQSAESCLSSIAWLPLSVYPVTHCKLTPSSVEEIRAPSNRQGVRFRFLTSQLPQAGPHVRMLDLVQRVYGEEGMEDMHLNITQGRSRHLGTIQPSHQPPYYLLALVILDIRFMCSTHCSSTSEGGIWTKRDVESRCAWGGWSTTIFVVKHVAGCRCVPAARVYTTVCGRGRARDAMRGWREEGVDGDVEGMGGRTSCMEGLPVAVREVVLWLWRRSLSSSLTGRAEGWTSCREEVVLAGGGQFLGMQADSRETVDFIETSRFAEDVRDGRFGGRCKERMTGDGTDKLASTSNVRLNSAPSETAISDDSDGQIDLVGGPFVVIRQAHSTSTHTHYAGVFTSLTRKLGVKHLEIAEVYNIEPWAC